MPTKRCDKCGSPLGFELDGEMLKSLVGIESLSDENGMQMFLSRLPTERWEWAARALNGEAMQYRHNRPLQR